MKKNLLAAISLVCLTAVFAGCNEENISIENKPADETTAAVTEVSTESTVSETTTEENKVTSETVTETTVAETEEKTEETDDSELKSTLFSVFQKYSEIDAIKATSGSVVKKDQDDVTELNGYTYIHVTSDNFSSIDEMRKYVKQYISGEEFDKFEEILTDTVPEYIDKDEKLYCIDGGRGSGFNFIENTLRIYDVTEDTVTAEIDFNNFGEENNDSMYAVFKRQDDNWVITRTEKYYCN